MLPHRQYIIEWDPIESIYREGPFYHRESYGVEPNRTLLQKGFHHMKEIYWEGGILRNCISFNILDVKLSDVSWWYGFNHRYMMHAIGG